MMHNTLTRRGFLAATAAMAASKTLPSFAFGQTAPLSLTATTRVLDINGCAATVFGLANAAGGQGLILDPGQRFRVDLTNSLDVETIIHWHGQIPPNKQDGVPNLPMPLLQPGETRSYDYAPMPGTYWMHSHVPVQEMNLLAAPLIVRSAEDVASDRQDVVMFLHDFSFRPAGEVLAEITGGSPGHDIANMGNTAAGGGAMAGMDHTGMDMSGDGMAMGGMAMDLNDFNFDAYLANDRTLSDPEVIAVESGGRIRLRVVNAAAATVSGSTPAMFRRDWWQWMVMPSCPCPAGGSAWRWRSGWISRLICRVQGPSRCWRCAKARANAPGSSLRPAGPGCARLTACRRSMPLLLTPTCCRNCSCRQQTRWPRARPIVPR